jgi:hypothetical protein
MRYPWAPVADHAAFALRTLKPREAVAPLIDLVDAASPSAPVYDAKSKQYTVREVVRLNHMRNCLLCHAPSENEHDGRVRGLVPTPGQPLPPQYYQSLSGDFVRADITYLRQDFSINLPEEHADPWPHEQRYDFVVRTRLAKSSELAGITASAASYPQREAMLYALRGITGKGVGTSSERWRELLGLIADKPNGDKRTPDLEKFATAPSDKKPQR